MEEDEKAVTKSPCINTKNETLHDTVQENDFTQFMIHSQSTVATFAKCI